jgi:hypothetical protein
MDASIKAAARVVALSGPIASTGCAGRLRERDDIIVGVEAYVGVNVRVGALCQPLQLGGDLFGRFVRPGDGQPMVFHCQEFLPDEVVYLGIFSTFPIDGSALVAEFGLA